MLEYLPELRPLRDFADAMQRLFAAEQTEEQAKGRWRRLQKHATYLAVPELKSVLQTMLTREKFAKMIAFLRNPASQKVRTNNHVERRNRKLRYWEKVRYKWRRRRTLVRFLVLAMDQWWQRALPQLEAARRGSRRQRQRQRQNTQKAARNPPPPGQNPLQTPCPQNDAKPHRIRKSVSGVEREVSFF